MNHTIWGLASLQTAVLRGVQPVGTTVQLKPQPANGLVMCFGACVAAETGDLFCNYHGWTFDGVGKCTSIPQLPADERSQRQVRHRGVGVQR